MGGYSISSYWKVIMPELNIDRWLQQVTTVIEVQDNR